MQHAFNFTLKKMICLKKHNNDIKVGLFYLYFETKKIRFFSYKKRRRVYVVSVCFNLTWNCSSHVFNVQPRGVIDFWPGNS